MPKRSFIPVLLFLTAFSAAAEPWSFAVISDNRQKDKRPEGAYENVLTEIRDLTFNPEPKFPPIELVVGAGDITVSADDGYNWKLWLETFKGVADKPCYFPVLGNHDSGDEAFNQKIILPAQKNVVGTDPKSYYVDWKNVRLIVGESTAKVEKLIVSAPDAIEHVFIADHYPVFPRHSHVEPTPAREAEFWEMLVRHHDRVKAYFCGHTHHYSRMRVANPSGEAKALDSFPDEEGGVYQVDSGNAGRTSHSDKLCTLVMVKVDGKDLTFRAVQAPHDKPDSYSLRDQWTLPGNASKPGK
jgi:hypothetical protein